MAGFLYKLSTSYLAVPTSPWVPLDNQLHRGLLFKHASLMRITLKISIGKTLIVFIIFTLALECAKRSAFLPDFVRSLILRFFQYFAQFSKHI